MRRTLTKRDKILAISGILFLLSILTGSTLALKICLTAFITIVVMNMLSLVNNSKVCYNTKNMIKNEKVKMHAAGVCIMVGTLMLVVDMIALWLTAL